MTLRLFAAALLGLCLVPTVARADATVFLGRNSAGDDRSATRGFAIGVSLLVIGFEFEYASRKEDQTIFRPSLSTTSGNVSAQTFGLPVQLYLTTGAGIFRERLGADHATGFVLNNGGGVKIPLAGPLRVRVDYRVFNLRGDSEDPRGNPRHKTIQRIYAGANLSF